MNTQRSEFFLLNKFVFTDKVNKVLEASVQVCLSTKLNNTRKVRKVDVCIHTEETLEDLAHTRFKIFREWGFGLQGEDSLIIELRFNPTHKQVNVFGSRNLHGLLVFDTVHPQIFERGASAHDGTDITGAEFRNCTIKKGDLIEEINGCRLKWKNGRNRKIG